MRDAVEIVAEELRVQREVGAPTPEAASAGAYLVLNSLHAGGWRIVPAQNMDTEEILGEWMPG